MSDGARRPIAGAASERDAAPLAACYPYVAIDVGEGDAEDAAALLFELGTVGVEWRDATTLARGAAGKVTLIASFERVEEAQQAASELPAAWLPRVEGIVGDAWRDEWKKHFAPFRIAGTIVVSPPWTPYQAESGESVIVLEPGRAFGTGLHETTSLVAQVLVDCAARFKGSPVLDVGCGSGILSLVALALGAARARAIDIDPEAVLVTRENATRNAIAERVHADGAPVSDALGQYATVVANLDAKTLVELGPALVKRVAPGGLLVVSGILAPDVAKAQLAEVSNVFSLLKQEDVRRKGEWIAVVWSA
jgi:ribosomal protein L11 methyltransferase